MKISCKQSAVRTSELKDRRIKGVRKLELLYHLVICKVCRIYNRQIAKLGRVSRLIGDACCDEAGPAEKLSDIKLSEDAKTRIKNNLEAG